MGFRFKVMGKLCFSHSFVSQIRQKLFMFFMIPLPIYFSLVLKCIRYRICYLLEMGCCIVIEFSVKFEKMQLKFSVPSFFPFFAGSTEKRNTHSCMSFPFKLNMQICGRVVCGRRSAAEEATGAGRNRRLEEACC